MCCLFGLIDYGHSLSRGERNRILTVLSTACEVRGTDAAGIAYRSRGQLHIYKRPRPARAMEFQIPGDAWAVMGHTRMTTQGSEKRNYNNHPFLGHVKEGTFALAHNGVIQNDRSLRKKLRLPRTRIETDSYVAVQLLERERALNFDSLRRMAEQLEGSYTITLLGSKNELYFIKGDNPMCLYHYPKEGVYLYASTREILCRALRYLRLPWGTPVSIPLECGEILRIGAEGHMTRSCFDDSKLFSRWYDPRWYPYLYRTNGSSDSDQTYLEAVKSVAATFGYSPEEMDELYRMGFTPAELEDFLYHGEL